MYRNLIANPLGKAEFIEYQLQKYYNFRVQAFTHAQVEEMAAQVATIADEHHLTDDASTLPEDKRRLGKREDHNALPDEVKAKYVENLSLLQRMRELHLRLRSRLTTRPAWPPSVIRSSKNLFRSTRNYTPTGKNTTIMLHQAPVPLPRNRRKPNGPPQVQLRNPPRSQPNEK